MSICKERLLHSGRILDLYSETHEMPDQRQADFEIIRHPGGSGALPVLDDGRIILIRQFRPAARGYLYEIPAGRLEPEEDARSCAERELIEEIGYRAGQVDSLGYVYSTIGFCTEKIYLFVARNLQADTMAHEPDEYIEPMTFSLEEALELIAQGQVTDAKTQIALMRYALKLEQK